MKQASNISELEFSEGQRTAVALGKFDSMHLGHQKLISSLVSRARADGLLPVVLTFSNHPNSVLAPDRVPQSVLGSAQRVELLEQLGVVAIVALEFDTALAQLSAENFVRHYLAAGLRAKLVVVGEGHRFGSGGQGTIDTLHQLADELDFECVAVPAISLRGQVISTTRVRELLQQGEVAQAAELLGRNHETVGIVERGRQWGRKLGFPTANLSRDSEGMLPADGIYAGWLWVDGERMPAAHSVGTNDTVGAVPRLVESHVLNRSDLDLYGQRVTVEYVQRIRGWQKFDSTEALVAQIGADVIECDRVLRGTT
jgi:riboflavin kinase/FMN adenylyltransferase